MLYKEPSVSESAEDPYEVKYMAFENGEPPFMPDVKIVARWERNPLLAAPVTGP
jgi:hypothetical protein